MQTLTLLHKKKIVEEYRRRKSKNENATQPVLARWAKEALRLEKVPNQSSISRIINNADKFATIPTDASESNKRNRPSAAPRLERALFQWISDRNNSGIAMNGDVIRFHAANLLKDANALLPPDAQISVTFSNGWMERFKKRYGLKFRRVHGEAMSADKRAIENEMPRIILAIATYKHCDVWNADEFGLFYRQPPSWTLANGPVSGFKKEKTRITLLACCNNDGSERMPLMIIGTAVRPRPFKGKFGSELGFDYHANRKAWMTKELFFAWLKRLDLYIGRTPGRKILLLLDNCSAHGKKEEMPPLHNVRVEFLPPNTTSMVQPMDAGIIAWVKAKYKRRLLFRVFENIEMGKKSIYNVDILTAIRWTCAEWDSCPREVIKNCFTHCLRQTGQTSTAELEKEINGDALQSMARDAAEHGVEFTRPGLESLLNPADEDVVAEEVIREELVRDVAGLQAEPVSNSDQDEREDSEEVYSFDEQLKSLAIAKATLERCSTLNACCVKAFTQCQLELRLQKARSMKQTTIGDFFGKK